MSSHSKEVKKKTINSVFWQSVSSATARLVYLVTTLILAKLLTPKDYGLIAIAWLVINTLALFRDAGVGKALIQRQTLVKEAADTAFVLIPTVCLFLYGLSYFIAPYLGAAFGDGQAESVIKVMSVTVIILSVGTVPSLMLEKELMFKRKIIPEISASFGYALVSISLALFGFGVWSLVFGEITRALFLASLIWFVSSWRPKFTFSRSLAKEMMGYGIYIIAFSIGTFIFYSIDNAVIGKVLGATLLGYYAFAFSLTNLPATKITDVLSRVIFPAYSKLQGDDQALRDSLLKTLEYVSMVIVPIGFAIFAVGPIFLKAMYGSKWLNAIPLLQVLWFYGLLRSILEITKSVFLATGNPKLFSRITILQLSIILPLIYFAAKHFATMGVAVLMTAAIFIGTLISIRWSSRLVGVKTTQSLLTLKLPFLFSTIASGAVIVYTRLVSTSNLVSLVTAIAAFSLVYSLLWWLFGKEKLLKITRIFGRAFGSRAGGLHREGASTASRM